MGGLLWGGGGAKVCWPLQNYRGGGLPPSSYAYNIHRHFTRLSLGWASVVQEFFQVVNHDCFQQRIFLKLKKDKLRIMWQYGKLSHFMSENKTHFMRKNEKIINK